MKGDEKMRVVRSSSTGGGGGLARKRFMDITNIQRRTRFEEVDDDDEEEDVMCPITPPTRIYIDTLIKENLTLMRLIGERNKLIELSGSEMMKMRTNMQRLQLQNLNLAQSNSFMLAELNLGREKIKSLQHEIICKDALLKAKKSGTAVTRQVVMDDVDPLLDTGLQIHRGVTRSQSMSRCMTLQRSRDEAERDMFENKSPMMTYSGCCMRRSRSAKYKSQHAYTRQHFFELDDPDYLAYNPPDYQTHGNTPSQSSSVSRTSHKVAENVGHCREITHGIRMR